MKFIDELKDMYDIRTLCQAVKLHHSVYYYHKQNKENSYNSYLDYLNETYTPRYPYFSSELGYNGQNSYTYQYTK